jgi:hypothetical protein
MNKFMIIIVLLFSFGFLAAQNILVWDYSGSYTIPNPDYPEDYQIETALIEALQANEIEPELVTSLPTDLAPYDAVFVISGIWCFS